MTAAPVTVVDRLPFTAPISPEQAAAYVRRKLPGWEETADRDVWIHFVRRRVPGAWGGCDVVSIPAKATFRDYAIRMREAVDALVALGCADRPSEVLRGMGEEKT